MRYDLIEDKKGKLTEKVLFDYYRENLPLREGMMIASKSILMCALRHRTAYIADDHKFQNRPSIVRIMPYLHERRVYFDKDTPGKYLVASMQLETSMRTQYNSNTCSLLY